MAKRQYFKTKVNLQDKYRSGTKLRKERDKKEKEMWMKSPEGRAVLEKAGLINSLSEALAAKVLSKSKEDESTNNLSEVLASKVNV